MSHLVGLVVVLGCLSYPVTTVAALLLGVPVGPANVVLKALMACLYAAVLVGAWRARRSIPWPVWPLLGLFWVYGLRLLWDVLVVGVQMEGYSGGYVLSYYFLLTMLPVLALSMATGPVSSRSLHAWVLGGLTLANLALAVQVLSADTLEILTLLAGRMEVAGEEENLAVLSPLTYGFMGAALAAFALTRLCLQARDGWAARAGLLALVFVGLANLLLGASRGPMAGFLLASLVLVVRMFLPRRAECEPPRWFAWVCIGLPAGALVLLASASDVAPSFLFERLASFASDRSGGVREERDYQFEAALADFVAHPLLGRHFVSSSDNFYPHNVPLEVLMSTGVVGGMLFTLAVAALLAALRPLLAGGADNASIPVATAGICMLFSGLTSASITSAPEFWIFLALLTSLGWRRTVAGTHRLPI